MKIKVCGMKYNTAEVASLQPDYLGFIFYSKSPRNYDLEEITSLTDYMVDSQKLARVGVFVNASVEEIMEKVDKYNLNVIQLHGEESPEFCKKLKICLFERSRELHQSEATEILSESIAEVSIKTEIEIPVLSGVEVWKVFSIKETFNFSELEPYETVVDKFLFDTKGKEKGGNGYTFNWNVLKDYKSKKLFILSGGIGLEELDKLQEIIKTNLPIYAIDVNSKFEIEPGLKKMDSLEKFIKEIRS